VFLRRADTRVLSFGERMIVKAVKAPAGDFRSWAEIDTWADGIDVALHADRAVGVGTALS
jgi:menaquinone-dependent protoporphyrinogen oxidase